MNAIEIEGLTKYYGRKIAVDDMYLDVPEATILGFLGPNGAGKTTTMNILMNFIFPSSGSARILGEEVGPGSSSYKQHLSFMGSEDFLYGNISAMENLSYIATLKNVKSPRARIKKYADLLDLDLHKKVRRLSKGSKRKVSLIAAIINNPRVLIMDEISSGLDPVVKGYIFESLLDLNREFGSTIFFSSHILSEVEALCDNAAFIKAGQIIKFESMNSYDNILFSLECKNLESFKKIELFLKRCGDEIRDLNLQDPHISFVATNSKMTHRFEEEGLFCCIDHIEITKESLEKTIISEYR